MPLLLLSQQQALSSSPMILACDYSMYIHIDTFKPNILSGSIYLLFLICFMCCNSYILSLSLSLSLSLYLSPPLSLSLSLSLSLLYYCDFHMTHKFYVHTPISINDVYHISITKTPPSFCTRVQEHHMTCNCNIVLIYDLQCME